MSQYSFDCIHGGEDTSVLMGWDVAIQGFFMVIEKSSDEDIPYWSNLIHAKVPHPKSLEPFLDVLNELGIKLPQEVFDDLVYAMKNNI